MTIEQRSRGDVLRWLKITGDADELRQFALQVLDAIDNGRAKGKVNDMKVLVVLEEGA